MTSCRTVGAGVGDSASGESNGAIAHPLSNGDVASLRPRAAAARSDGVEPSPTPGSTS